MPDNPFDITWNHDLIKNPVIVSRDTAILKAFDKLGEKTLLYEDCPPGVVYVLSQEYVDSWA